MPNVTLPLPLQSPLLAASGQNRVRHGFFTRQGGVSEGLYRGLNVGLGSHTTNRKGSRKTAGV